MIGRLSGRLMLKQPPQLLVDVAGVGYECEAPMSTFYKLPAVGESVTLHTHLSIRDDAHLLYAFCSAEDRQLFRGLIKVTGIGPKIALAILSGVSADEFWNIVRNGEVDRLIKVPGIGRKTGERLLVELRDKAGDVSVSGAPTGAAGRTGPIVEARSALESLGYKPLDAQKMIDTVKSEDMSAEELIREALKRAVR